MGYDRNCDGIWELEIRDSWFQWATFGNRGCFSSISMGKGGVEQALTEKSKIPRVMKTKSIHGSVNWYRV